MSAEIAEMAGRLVRRVVPASLPGWPASVESSDQVTPPSVLSKIPGISTPTSSRPFFAARFETFDIFFSPSAS